MDVALAPVAERVGVKYVVESLAGIEVCRDRPGRGGKGGVTSFKSSSEGISIAGFRELTSTAFSFSDLEV